MLWTKVRLDVVLKTLDFLMAPRRIFFIKIWADKAHKIQLIQEFRQESAACHTYRDTKDLLREKFYDRVIFR